MKGLVALEEAIPGGEEALEAGQNYITFL